MSFAENCVCARPIASFSIVWKQRLRKMMARKRKVHIYNLHTATANEGLRIFTGILPNEHLIINSFIHWASWIQLYTQHTWYGVTDLQMECQKRKAKIFPMKYVVVNMIWPVRNIQMAFAAVLWIWNVAVHWDWERMNGWQSKIDSWNGSTASKQLKSQWVWCFIR